MIGPIIFTLLAVSVGRLLLGLLRNQRIARATGLPCILFPVSEFNVIYQMLFENSTFLYVVNNCLPLWLADYMTGSTYRGRWTAKDRPCKRYGKVHMFATPTTISCNVSDASVVSQIFKARRNFPKPVQIYSGLDLFGPNVVVSEHHEWAHHRRHTAPPFNEKSNVLVWQESIRISTEMIEHWRNHFSQRSSPTEFIVPNSREDILKLTLYVLCSAGFGVKLPFQNVVDATMTSSKALFRDTQLPPHGYQFTFRSVMEYLNKNLMSVFFANWIIPQWIPRGMLPFWKRDFYAYDDLVKYFRALISSTDTSQSSPPNLLEEMVRSQLDNDKGQERGLSDWELQGNMFVFIIAGHETTATALRFALVLLAIDQEIQNWMSKDILEVIRSEPVEPAKWDYNALFPKLVTLLCVMLETLRLYPPAVTVPKWTGESPAEIVYDGQHYLLPAHTGVNLNAVPLHYASEYWGPNAINFDPSRWDKRNTKSFLAENGDLDGLTAPGLEYNTIHKPIRGAYFPFADGNRACLGKKFAQTEFVATLAVIFREFQVKLARNKDETEEAAIQRAKKVLNESSSLITLAMRDAVPLQFIKRW